MQRTRIPPQAMMAAADGNGRRIPSTLPEPSHPAGMPEADLLSLRGIHSHSYKTPFQNPFSAALPNPCPFHPSNLVSFVNISWAACMRSCTKIFLTIEAVITLLHYILHKVILFFLLPILPKGECIHGKEKTVTCKQP